MGAGSSAATDSPEGIVAWFSASSSTVNSGIGATTARDATAATAVAATASPMVFAVGHTARRTGSSINRADTVAIATVIAIATVAPRRVSSCQPRSRSSTNTGQWNR